MINIFLLEGILVVFSVSAAIIAWSLYREAAIEAFGPKVEPDELLDNTDIQSEMRRRGRLAEVARAIVVAMISTTILVIFGVSSIDSVSLFSNVRFLLLLDVPILLTTVWCFYLGPRKLVGEDSRKTFRPWHRKSFRPLVLPYLFWIPYIVGVYYLMGGLAVLNVAEVALADYQNLSGTPASLQVGEIQSMEDVLQGALRLAGFGRWMAVGAQKYLVVSILLFVFLIVEQHSYMEGTQWLGNLDALKIAVGLIFLATIAVGLIILPMEYGRAFSIFQASIETRFAKETSMADLDRLLSLQQFLDNHDLNWVFLSILTGRGNLLALIFLGGIVLIKRVFFEELPWQHVANLMLPSFITKRGVDLRRLMGIKGLPVSANRAKRS